MRAAAKIVLLAVLILSCTVSTFAQEKLWDELCSKVGMLYQQGRYSEAAKLAQQALTVAEKTFGPNHPYMATSLNNLARLYQDQGKYAEAEPLYKRSLKIAEKALGPDHPQVATVYENLAGLYKKIGKEDEAEKLEARARKIRSNQ
jgi:tetratricopeptide (TPR) repeat protein